MAAADCNDLSACRMQASAAGTVLRTLGDRGSDWLAVEDFGCVGDGMHDDHDPFQGALDWSAENKRPVIATRAYLLATQGLTVKSNTTLICAPNARIIRGQGFGGDAAGIGAAMLSTLGGDVDQPDVHIEGGLWGFDYGPTGRKTWTGLTVRFLYDDPVDPKTSLLTIGGGLTRDQFANYTKAIWLYGQPASANNDRVFAFAPDSDQPSDLTKIRVLGVVTDESPTSGFTASVVPPAGGGVRLRSRRGLVRGVKLINTRGFGYFLGGDNFRLLDSSSRDVTPDGGGGVRFSAGADMLGSRLYIESSDDCFQFNPTDKKAGDATGATITRSSFVDCLGRTNQGALIAFCGRRGAPGRYSLKVSTVRWRGVKLRNMTSKSAAPSPFTSPWRSPPLPFGS